LLDLEASLRRDQRRLPEALHLLDRALELSNGTRATARILIKRAKTLEEMGDYEGTTGALRQADPLLLTEQHDSRLLLCLRFNLFEILCLMGRFPEVEPLMPEVRALAEGLGNELDLVRLRWMEAKLWAGLGRLEEALAALRWVASEFAMRGIAYDAALVTLEAAVLLADEGRTQEVKRLARETAPIFKAQGVGREALATLRLFCQAAEAERLTGTLARHLLNELRRKTGEAEWARSATFKLSGVNPHRPGGIRGGRAIL
jgi:tetratricopeptide (TPR) repeat protein